MKLAAAKVSARCVGNSEVREVNARLALPSPEEHVIYSSCRKKDSALPVRKPPYLLSLAAVNFKFSLLGTRCEFLQLNLLKWCADVVLDFNSE